MKVELTPELRTRFTSQYFGQEVVETPTLVWTGNPPEPSHDEWSMAALDSRNIDFVISHNIPICLRNLQSLTKEEVIEIAKIATDGGFYGLNKSGWIVSENFGTGFNGKPDGYFEISHKKSSHKVCIDIVDGEIDVYEYDSEKMIEEDAIMKDLIWAYQYMIGLGVAIPFMGHSIDDLVEAGWVSLVGGGLPQS